MAEYHVGNSPITNTIYAGTLNKTKTMWRNKSDVTEEALACVRDHLFQLANDDGKPEFGGFGEGHPVRIGDTGDERSQRYYQMGKWVRR